MIFFLAKKFRRKSFLPRSSRILHAMVGCGVALSVAALIITLGVASGFEKEFTKALLDFHAPITIFPDPILPLTEAQLKEALTGAELDPHAIQTLQPFLYKEGLLIHQGVIKGVVLKGIEGLEHKEGLVLGEALAKKMGLGTKGEERKEKREKREKRKERREKRGEKREEIVKLLIPKPGQVSSQETIRLPVVGTFRSGLYEIDEQFALIDLSLLKKLFQVRAEVQGFEIKLANPDLAAALTEKLKNRLPPYVSIQSWDELNQPLLEAFALEKLFFKILIGFMVLVSLLNLMASLLLTLFRKKKAIAILRALGMSVHRVRTLFAYQGLRLGLQGVFAGCLFGLGFLAAIDYFHWIPLDPEVYFLTKLPIDFVPFDVLMIFLFASLGAGLVSWVTASRVGSMAIREGLHAP